MTEKLSDTAVRLIQLQYQNYHKPEYIFPDPLAVVKTYTRKEDLEVAGLLCSSLALGRVQAIVQITERVMRHFPSPGKDILSCTLADFRELFGWFVYRFFRADDLASLLLGIRRTIEDYGSLNSCFLSFLSDDSKTILPALTGFTCALRNRCEGPTGILLPDVEKGSASKRLNLYLRWMVRKDAVDPGPWEGVSPAKLLYPMDTHMLRISRELGITHRRQADLKTTLEVTEAFRTIEPRDPVKYDFSLTRQGLHPRVARENPEYFRRRFFDAEH